MKTRLLIIALAVNLASATLTHAQQLGGPSGSVGWSETATLCKLLPGSPATTFNYATGAVNFTSRSFGKIGLACSVPGIMDGVDVGSINSYAFSFNDPSGANWRVYCRG
jgi:hypothetical protein